MSVVEVCTLYKYVNTNWSLSRAGGIIEFILEIDT